MALLGGIEAFQQSAVANKPHSFGFNTARAAADDLLLQTLNGTVAADRKFAVDLNGYLLAAPYTAGDVLYSATSSVTGVKRITGLAIGSAGKVLRSSGTAPTWSTATIPDTAAAGDLLYGSATNVWTALAVGSANTVLTSSGSLPQWSAGLTITTLTTSGLISANAGLTVASAQTLTVTGATVTGLTAASVGAGTFPAGAFVFQGAVSGITTLGASGLITASGGLTVASGQTLTLTGATVAGQPTWSSTQSMSITGTAAGGTSGNAATATALQTPRAINGVNFDGTAAITVTAAAGTLTGTTLNATVVASSLTSVGTLSSLTVSGLITANGGLTVASGQTLTLTGATVTGLTVDASNVTAGTFPAGTFTFQGLIASSYAVNPAASTTYGYYLADHVRFRIQAGDETNAGTIGYRVVDANSLAIVGAGTSSSNRLVRVFDHLAVNAAPSTTYALLLGGSLSVLTTTGPQVTVRYDASNRLDISVAINGAVTYDAVGASAGHSFSDLLTATAGLTVTGTGVVVGAPTGGDQGVGTINAVAVYDDGAGPLTDYVFERYYGLTPKDRPDYELIPLAGLRAFTAKEYRLPMMPSRETFEQERSLGRLVHGLWEMTELHTTYLFDHDTRITALEAENQRLREALTARN